MKYLMVMTLVLFLVLSVVTLFAEEGTDSLPAQRLTAVLQRGGVTAVDARSIVEALDDALLLIPEDRREMETLALALAYRQRTGTLPQHPGELRTLAEEIRSQAHRLDAAGFSRREVSRMVLGATRAGTVTDPGAAAVIRRQTGDVMRETARNTARDAQQRRGVRPGATAPTNDFPRAPAVHDAPGGVVQP